MNIGKAAITAETVILYHKTAKDLFGDRYDEQTADARHLVSRMADVLFDGHYLKALIKLLNDLDEAGIDDPGTRLRLIAASVDLMNETPVKGGAV